MPEGTYPIDEAPLTEPMRLACEVSDLADELEGVLVEDMASWPAGDWPARMDHAAEITAKINGRLDGMRDEYTQAVGQESPCGLVLTPADLAFAQRLVDTVQAEADRGDSELAAVWEGLAANLRTELFTS